MPAQQPVGAHNSHLLSHVRLGDEIEVWWPYDRQYYPGIVAAVLPDGRRRVHYTDGDSEELALATEQWRFRGVAAARVSAALMPRTSAPPLDVPSPDDGPPLQGWNEEGKSEARVSEPESAERRTGGERRGGKKTLVQVRKVIAKKKKKPPVRRTSAPAAQLSSPVPVNKGTKPTVAVQHQRQAPNSTTERSQSASSGTVKPPAEPKTNASAPARALVLAPAPAPVLAPAPAPVLAPAPAPVLAPAPPPVPVLQKPKPTTTTTATSAPKPQVRAKAPVSVVPAPVANPKLTVSTAATKPKAVSTQATSKSKPTLTSPKPKQIATASPIKAKPQVITNSMKSKPSVFAPTARSWPLAAAPAKPRTLSAPSGRPTHVPARTKSSPGTNLRTRTTTSPTIKPVVPTRPTVRTLSPQVAVRRRASTAPAPVSQPIVEVVEVVELDPEPDPVLPPAAGKQRSATRKAAEAPGKGRDAASKPDADAKLKGRPAIDDAAANIAEADARQKRRSSMGDKQRPDTRRAQEAQAKKVGKIGAGNVAVVTGATAKRGQSDARSQVQKQVGDGGKLSDAAKRHDLGDKLDITTKSDGVKKAHIVNRIDHVKSNGTRSKQDDAKQLQDPAKKQRQTEKTRNQPQQRHTNTVPVVGKEREKERRDTVSQKQSPGRTPESVSKPTAKSANAAATGKAGEKGTVLGRRASDQRNTPSLDPKNLEKDAPKFPRVPRKPVATGGVLTPRGPTDQMKGAVQDSSVVGQGLSGVHSLRNVNPQMTSPRMASGVEGNIRNKPDTPLGPIPLPSANGPSQSGAEALSPYSSSARPALRSELADRRRLPPVTVCHVANGLPLRNRYPQQTRQSSPVSHVSLRDQPANMVAIKSGAGDGSHIVKLASRTDPKPVQNQASSHGQESPRNVPGDRTLPDAPMRDGSQNGDGSAKRAVEREKLASSRTPNENLSLQGIFVPDKGSGLKQAVQLKSQNDGSTASLTKKRTVRQKPQPSASKRQKLEGNAIGTTQAPNDSCHATEKVQPPWKGTIANISGATTPDVVVPKSAGTVSPLAAGNAATSKVMRSSDPDTGNKNSTTKHVQSRDDPKGISSGAQVGTPTTGATAALPAKELVLRDHPNRVQANTRSASAASVIPSLTLPGALQESSRRKIDINSLVGNVHAKRPRSTGNIETKGPGALGAAARVIPAPLNRFPTLPDKVVFTTVGDNERNRSEEESSTLELSEDQTRQIVDAVQRVKGTSAMSSQAALTRSAPFVPPGRTNIGGNPQNVPEQRPRTGGHLLSQVQAVPYMTQNAMGGSSTGGNLANAQSRSAAQNHQHLPPLFAQQSAQPITSGHVVRQANNMSPTTAPVPMQVSMPGGHTRVGPNQVNMSSALVGMQRSQPSCQVQPLAKAAGQNPHSSRSRTASGQLAQRAAQAGVNRSRMTQHGERASASLSVDVLMKTIAESTMRAMQGRIAPLTAHIDQHYKKIEELVKKQGSEVSDKEIARLSAGQDILKKALEQGVSKDSLITAVSTLTSKVMLAFKTEMSQIRRDLFRDIKNEMNQITKDLYRDIKNEFTELNEKLNAREKVVGELDKKVCKIVEGHLSEKLSALGRVMEEMDKMTGKLSAVGGVVLALDKSMTDGNRNVPHRALIREGLAGPNVNSATGDAVAVSRGVVAKEIQPQPTGTESITASLPPNAKIIESETVAIQARELMGKAVVEWMLNGGCRDAAPATEREQPVSISWVKETSRACLGTIFTNLEKYSLYRDAVDGVSRNLGKEEVEVAWLVQVPSRENLTKARINYSGWDPQLYDFEWESERKVLLLIAVELLKAEKELLTRRMRISDPLVSAVRCIRLTRSRMGV